MITLVFFLVGCNGQLAKSEEKPELGRYFQGATGAFVLFDQKDNEYIRYNPERCAERFI
jgi:beta-lactamase class D